MAELQSEKGQAASWKVALPVYGGVRDHLTFGRSVGVDSIRVVVLWCIYSYENLLVSVTRRRPLFFLKKNSTSHIFSFSSAVASFCYNNFFFPDRILAIIYSQHFEKLFISKLMNDNLFFNILNLSFVIKLLTKKYDGPIRSKYNAKNITR